MTDKYLKRVLTVIAAALTILAVRPVLTETSVEAQTKARRHCTWSFIQDVGNPNIPENGSTEAAKRNDAWAKMSDDGWELKAAFNDRYIFEKCDQ